MPARPIRIDPAGALSSGLDAIRDEAGVPASFPPEVLAEAEAAASGARAEAPRVELAFVTVDPPGSRDLDQAIHI
ncbi:MAG TPA: hypothetical protein VF259_02515, partial [Solirubrobacterales bacterium]